MKKFLLLILVAAVNTAFADHITQKFLVQFASNQHELDSTALTKLEEVNAFLLLHPSAKVKLTGRTDYDGSIGYNINLSRKRTTQVSDFLEQKGWKNTEINEKWLGESKPLANNKNDNGKALNRSVEIEITILNYANTSEWLSEQQNNTKKEYRLTHSGENKIITSNENILTIPANAFVDENGKVIDNKNVKLVLTEISSSFDAIIHQAFTTSGDRIIETGGMINMEAFNGSNPLLLAGGKEINISIPALSAQNDMLIFEGTKDKNGNIDWKTKGSSFAMTTNTKKVSLKLNENLLEQLMKQIDMDKPQMQANDINYDMPVFKNMPVQPREPNKPLKPSAKSSMSTFAYLFSNQKSRDVAIEKAYEKKWQKYLLQLEKYKQRMVQYEKLKTQHKDEFQKYEEAKNEFFCWIEQNLENIKKEKNEFLQFHDRKRIYVGLKQLCENSKNEKLFTTQPLRIFKEQSSKIGMDDKEMLTFNYLSALEKTLNYLKTLNYAEIEKKYTFRNKLRITSLLSKNMSGERYSYRLNNNEFLDSFLKENQSVFSTLFQNEWDWQLGQWDYKRQMAEMNKRYQKEEEQRKYFSGNTSSLGWINCDRFVDQPVVKINCKKDSESMQVVVLKDIKSILNTYYDMTENINYANLPVNQKFKLVTFKIEGETAYVSIQEATAQKGLELEPVMKKMPLDEANKLIAGL